MSEMVPRAMAGLSSAAASKPPSDAPGADQQVDLIDEQHEPPVGLFGGAHHRMQPLFELPSRHCARHEQREVQRKNSLRPEAGGNPAFCYTRGQAFDDCRFAYSGLTDQHRCVLHAAAEDGDYAPCLRLPADNGVQAAESGLARQVAAKARDQRWKRRQAAPRCHFGEPRHAPVPV